MMHRRTCRRWGMIIVALAALGHDGLAWALEATISARYQGDAQGRFENTTPQAGFCSRWPNDCRDVYTVGLPIEFTKTSFYKAPDSRDQFFVQLPSSRTINVSHEVTGETHALTFEITHVSQRVIGNSRDNPTFTASIYGGCGYKGTWGSTKFSQYLWTVKNPSNPSGCYSSNHSGGAGHFTENQVIETGIAYRLKMPAPLKMKQGLYRGSVDFSVGPGGDFDFGNGVTELNDTRLTLNFELDVQHAFVLQFPPGSDRAVLEPPGGWQAWLGGRGTPPRLERDIPFRIWSTGPFKVYTQCSVPYGGLVCGIVDDRDTGVAVMVALDMPPEILFRDKPAQRVTILMGKSNAMRFDHMLPASNRPANLHFEVTRLGVEILARRPGVTYEGIVTLIFDADL